MLESNHAEKMSLLLNRLSCRIVMPDKYADLQNRRGILPSDMRERRRHARVYCPSKILVESFPTLPAIPRNHQYVVGYSVNISKSGICFLHDTQLFPGERVTLWTHKGQLTAMVARCMKYNDQCFEVGAMFHLDEPDETGMVETADDVSVASDMIRSFMN